MKKKLILALSMTVTLACQANVHGPDRNGVYQVDQWGSKVELVKIDYELSYELSGNSGQIQKAGL